MIRQSKAIANKIGAIPRTLFSFISKDFKLLFKKKKYLYLSLALPLLLGIIYISMLGTGSGHPAVIVCDQDDTEITAQAMDSIEGFDITRTTASDCVRTVNKEVKEKNYVFGVHIEKGFSEQIENLQQASMTIYYDNSDPSLSSLAQWKFDNALLPYKTRIVKEFASTLSEEAGEARETLDATTQAISGTSPRVKSMLQEQLSQPRHELKRVEELDTEFIATPIRVDKQGIHETDFKMIDLGLAPLFIILNLFLVLMLSATGIIYERRNKIFQRVRTSVSTTTSYVLAKIVVFTVITAAQFFLLLLLFLAFGATFTINVPLLLKAIAFIGIINTLIGILIGFIADSEGVAVLISLIITLPLLFLSGMFYPVDMLPQAVQALSKITPMHAEILMLKQAILFKAKTASASFLAPLILFLITVIASKKVD